MDRRKPFHSLHLQGTNILVFVLHLFCCLYVTPFIQAQEVFRIGQIQKEYDLNAYVTIYTSIDLSLDLAMIVDEIPANAFIPLNRYLDEKYPNRNVSKPQKLNSEYVYWYKVRIYNAIPQRLEDNDWLLFTGKCDNTKVYVLDTLNAVLDSMQTGYMIPNHLKGFKFGNQYPDRVKLSIPAHQTVTILIRSFAPNKRKPWIDVRLTTEDFFHNWDFVVQSRRDYMLIGFLLTFIILSLFLSWSTRDRVFLFHALFQLGILIYLLEFFYLLYDLPWLRNHPVYAQTVIYLSLCGMDIAAVQFIRTFLYIQKKFPKWDWIFQTMMYFRLAVLVGVMILFYTGNNMPLSDNITASYIIFHYLSLVSLVWFIKESGKRRYFLIIGTLLFMIGVMLNAASVIIGTGVQYGYIQIAVLGEVLVFTLGLGYRLKILIREERQAIVFKEMDAFKTRFYTNITHEFRTPLTIIQGFVDQLKSGIFNQKQQSHLSLIKKNSNRLMHLVNRLLDLSKLQSGKMDLELRQGNIIGYLRYLFYSFQSFAMSKGVHMRFLTEVEEFDMDFDAEKIQDVVTNLVSNAIKFTPEGGHISILVKPIGGNDRNEELLFQVKDSGTGMSKMELKHVFERFYRSKGSKKKYQGTGLGLAITRELVTLMKGKIEVTSEEGQGSEFSVYLPVTRLAPKSKFDRPKPMEIDLRDEQVQVEPQTIINQGKPLALIVEDSYDVVLYLKHLLEKDYNVAVAFDGAEGVEKAISLVPDLIISDVIMPEKDGLELCMILKSDERTSHIPIILATAKAKIEDRLAGLQHGADAYLSKPFNQEELFLYLQNFLALREKMQDRYSKLQPGGMLPEDEAHKLFQTQDAFVSRAMEIVKEHIEDEGYGTTQLARTLAMSRSQLHRKITALTGHPASHFMNSIRINEAKYLLQNSNHNVSEIAYQVGLEPNYFSRIFKEDTGLTPSEFRGGQ